jgi:hypothetical protein
MLQIKNKLTILHDDDGNFEDYSTEALDFDRDTFTLSLTNTNYLYVGFYKPINFIYLSFSTKDTVGSKMSGEYWNGSAWTGLNGYYDETRAFTRDGFMQWERGQENEAKTSVDSIELFWYRFKPEVSMLDGECKGINIVFSDDQDLKKRYHEIDEYLPQGETSHLLSHVAARDEIIQALRSHREYKNVNGSIQDVTAFDLLDISQARLASTYLTLSIIFGSVFDDPDGIYRDRAKMYKEAYSNVMRNPYIDIDKNDDGIKDNNEIKIVTVNRSIRR